MKLNCLSNQGKGFLFILCLALNTPALANVQLTAQQTAALSGLCDGTGSGFAATKFQQGVLVFGAGKTDPAHEALPATIQADSYAEAGLILCLDYQETEIDQCDYWLFDVPRVRVDVQARLISVRSPANPISSMSMVGQEPPNCNLAGIITSRTKKISGQAPDASALMDFLESSGANLHDSDGDGLNNLVENISGTDPQVFDEADVTSLISVNGSSSLEVVESENVTLALDFDPGNYSNQTADYTVWINSGEQIFSYVLGSGFEETPLPEITVRGKAKKFRNFPLTTLPTFGSGDYQLNFSVAIDGEVITNSFAMLSVISNEWVFEEVGLRAGIDHQHGFLPEDDDLAEELTLLVSGVAAGDYDKDGWVDLYFTQGDIGKNLLYRNLGNGSFIEVAEEAGVDIALPANVIDDDTQAQNSGATFADYDGDGWLDLMVNGINKTTQPILFRNNQDGTFSDVTQVAKIPIVFQSMSSSFADYDKDGDLDFLITHWMSNAQEKRLFRQNADNTFTDVSETAGLEEVITNGFTGNFADINNDGWLDILIAADFGTSQVFMSDGDGTFTTVTGPEITDDFGMGATVGDFDNDGDLDWFVTSVYDHTLENPEVDGNRLYSNNGDGTFTDITGKTRTRDGGWGWGTCFADFNNDGFLDLFQTNGYTGDHNPDFGIYLEDRSRLFVNLQDGSFTNQAEIRGVDDTHQGRGVICFDYDRDGDIDILVANNRSRPRLYENRGLYGQHWLDVRLEGEDKNTEAIGARVYLTSNGISQMRELRAGSNFLSQDPVVAHFGLGSQTVIEEIRVVWPSGRERILTDIDADQTLYISP